MPINRRSFLTGALLPFSAGAGAVLASAAAEAAPARAGTSLIPDSGRDMSRELQRLIDDQAARGRPVLLPPGRVIAGNLRIPAGLQLVGMPGRSVLEWSGRGSFLTIFNAHDVRISGITFDGRHAPMDGGNAEPYPGLVRAVGAKRLRIEHCRITNSAANGVTLEKCSGSLVYNRIDNAIKAGIFAQNSTGLEISHNELHDIANNAIQVWRSAAGEDGTLVTGNRIRKVASMDGGNGQNGNGINIFRAGNVNITDNRITDCAFSAVRVNAGNQCHITNNSCSRLGEVAIFVEFGYLGAVVSQNSVEHAAIGISITNMDVGGRLAVCQGNLVRELFYRGKRTDPESGGIGIAAEADVAITGNTIEGAPRAGLLLGWGPYMKNLNASSNNLSRCGTGIAATVVPRAGKAIIANNIISGAKHAAIRGMKWLKPATGDLLKSGTKRPANLFLSGNISA
ncbi:MAG TPA: TIGR03808 family TAT-translocated repetitive protein [Rhizobiales bacterium]|nr:TIGR03808 family TAT-translocated repetitive protein [Hyphomicrobiales bacterium]